MSNIWNKIKEQTTAYREHLEKMPETTEIKSACYVVTREEIEKLLNQKKDGSLLDGIRIYIGGHSENGALIPTIHILACEKDAHNNFHDYNVPETMPENATLQHKALPLLAEVQPCPPVCGKSNFLNS